MTPPCEPMNIVPCWSVPSKASSRSASTYSVSPVRRMTWMWWPPCPNSTVPLPSTVISGVASFATPAADHGHHAALAALDVRA